MKYMTKMRQGRERGGEGGGGGGKVGGVHRFLDHTYLELSVARATVVNHIITKTHISVLFSIKGK